MAMMADCVGFQAQIASIIELLANSAVLEICKLVDDGYAALRSQMEREREQSDKENNDLRQKLRDMDVRVRSYERKLRRRNQRNEMHNVPYKPPEAPCAGVAVTDGHPRVHLDLPEDDPEIHHIPQDDALLPQVKKERPDCDLNLKVEVNIRSQTNSSAPELTEEAHTSDKLNTSSSPCSSPEATVDLTCRPKSKPRPKPSKPSADPDAALKPETLPDCAVQLPPPPVEAERSPERLSGLGLDLAWMQERVGHLGAAFAQASLSNADIGHPSCSYPPQVDMEVPPTLLYPGNAHEMSAFPSFDLPNASSLANQRQPCKTTAAKEPMVCNFCGRVFPSVASLEVHQRSHTGERPYSCQHCGKGFAQPNNLRVHLLIHSGERRYRCSLCGKSFISSSHLKRHRTVHTQEKPYSCARCGQSFSQLCSVRRHRQQSQCGL